jgi:hypothetical protein
MSQRARVRLTDAERRPSSPHPTGPTLLDAMADPNLFRQFFPDLKSWSAWRTFIAAVFGLDMTADQLAVYRACTGRQEPPVGVAKECWLCIGRRGGKSRIMALLPVFVAMFIDHGPHLAHGETGVVQVLAADRRQARVLLRYVKAFISQTPMLARLIAGETNEAVLLLNQISIEVATASFRSVRGRTVVAAILDEVAFWQSDDSANPDVEILAAIRPSMLTVPNSMLIAASSPYSRRGVLYDAYKRHYGKDGPVLVWQSDTKTMNPAADQSVIDKAYEEDPVAASAEYGGLFRNDIDAFISRESVEAVVSVGIFERAPVLGVRYSAFVDPSGGAADSFTLAIAHLSEDKVAVLDAIRERKPPFSPEDVIGEFATLLKSYGVYKILGDRFGGEFPRELFRKRGINYDPASKPKSDLYREALPLINSRKCDLLDHQKLVAQFIGLERRTARSGKDSIDHAPNGHDDVVNSVAGVLTTLTSRPYRYLADLSWVASGNIDEEWRAGRLSQFIFNGGYKK